MDLKHIIPQQRRRTYGPSFDIAFSTDKSDVSRVGPTPVFSRASSGTFVNENRRIVGKTTSTTSLNPASVPVGGVAVFAVPSGSVVGWLNNSVVSVMEDTDGDDQIGAQRHVTGTLIHKTDTAITLLVTSKSGTTTLSSWFVSYRGLRNDHNPATGLCLGALIEESRTNLYARSEDLSDPTWGKNRVLLQTNATTAPDGTMTADKVIEDTTASNTHNISNGTTPPATAHTLSVFVKKAELDWIILRISGVNTAFNLNTGQPTTSTMSPTTTRYPDGWYRFTVTGSAGTQGSFFLSRDGVNTSYTGDGTSGVFIWGAQLEAGSSATSYIPTTAAATIRSADFYDITGTDFSRFYNQTEGTLFISSRRTQPTGPIYTSMFTINDGTGSNRIYIGNEGNPNDIGFNIARSGATVYAGNLINGTLIRRGALAYSPNSTNRSYNGNIGTDVAISLAPTVNRAGFGTHQLISSARYFRTRLSNSQIQSLTTLVSEPLVYNGIAIWYNGEGLIETN